MTKETLTLNLSNIKYNLIVLDDYEDYSELIQKSVPIFQDYRHYLILHRMLNEESPDFNHPRFYIALKTLFGKSSIVYDDYKCSFAYHFLISITKGKKASLYTLKFCDLSHKISFINYW